MNVMIKTSFLAATVILLAACSSSPTSQYLADQEHARQVKNEAMEKSISEAPDWFMTPPHSDENGVFATAMGQADNLMAARNMATLNAEFAIAKTIHQEVSGRERQNTEVRDGRTQTINDQTIVKYVRQANVVGYNTVDQKVVVENGQYVYYVLLHLPYSKMQRMLEMLNDDFKQRSERAYKEVTEQASVQGVNSPANQSSSSLTETPASVAPLNTNVTQQIGHYLAGGVK